MCLLVECMRTFAKVVKALVTDPQHIQVRLRRNQRGNQGWTGLVGLPGIPLEMVQQWCSLPGPTPRKVEQGTGSKKQMPGEP